MATYEIPLSPEAQTFSISLNGVQYQMRLVWNTQALLWVLDLLSSEKVPLLSGIPLTTGRDLLSPFAYMEFGGELIAYTDGDELTPPNYENLGGLGKLTFVTPD